MAEFFTGQAGAENRRYPRLKLKLWVHYRPLKQGESAAGPLESLAEDVGARGTAVRSSHAMRIGQLLMVTLYLPPENKRGEADTLPIFAEKDCLPVDILSRVVWCRAKDEHEFLLGIQFLDPDPSHRRRLKDFLVDYNLDKPESALYT